MGERLVAWQRELQDAHHRLERALDEARAALERGEVPAVGAREVLDHCHAFCGRLGGHHRSEDTALFPRLLAAAPELAPVVDRLRADHVALAALLSGFEAALTADPDPDVLATHLDGIEALMASHFGYEERALDGALRRLGAPAAERSVLLGV